MQLSQLNYAARAFLGYDIWNAEFCRYFQFESWAARNPSWMTLSQLSHSISAGGDFYTSRALQFGGTERNWQAGLHMHRKNIRYIFGFFSASLMVILAPDEGLGLFSLLLFGQSELCDESGSQALLYNGQVLCMPPLNHGTSHPWGITIPWSAFLLKSAAWKDLMLRSKLISFRCSS